MTYRSRTPYTIFVFFLFVLLLCSCSMVEISQDYNYTKQPAPLQTFNWSAAFLSHGGVQKSDPLLHDRFISAVNWGLTEKGYTLSQDPDFLIRYWYEIDSKLRTDPTPQLILTTGRRYDGYHGVDFITSTPGIEQVEIGFLTIDFINKDTGQVFWRGRGSRPVQSHYSPQRLTEIVNELVAKVLSQYR